MNKLVCFGAITVSLFLLSNTSFGAPVKGAESILLKAGSKGDVLFPHGIHQGVTVDCQPCHGLLPKESAIVGKMQTEGKLQKKEVMNMCRECHKELASKGERAGPTACAGCHEK
ncbi:MAG: cytochrome c3 family protein [Desulfobulbaceae bacterium]|jgi:hypothetical protein|nr:cytochrome c3 family protein [Desulfobulbaceae bacterium]